MSKLAARPRVDTSKLNFDIDLNDAVSLGPIAAAAWDTVRGNDDATFAASASEHQHKLLAHAKSALTTGAQTGKTSWARFEQAVGKFKGEFDKAVEARVANPAAVPAVPARTDIASASPVPGKPAVVTPPGVPVAPSPSGPHPSALDDLRRGMAEAKASPPAPPAPPASRPQGSPVVHPATGGKPSGNK